MKYEEIAMNIPGNAIGIYIAHPTTHVLKPTYKGHKTLVNHDDTKIGKTSKDFVSREDEYMRTFQYEVAFFPILVVAPEDIDVFEDLIRKKIGKIYARSGAAREWFHTTARQEIAELVWETAKAG